MAIAAMKKIRLIVHESVASNVLGVVQEMGIFELTPIKDSPELSKREKKTFEYNYMSSRLDYAVEFLSRYDTSRGKLRNLIEGVREHINSDDVTGVMKDFYVEDVIGRLEEYQKTLNTCRERVRHLEKEQQILEKWKSLEVSLGMSFETKTTRTIFLEKKNVTRKKKERQKEMEYAFREKRAHVDVIEVAGEGCVLLTYMISEEDTILEVVKQRDYEEVTLPKRRGTPKEEIERINRAIKKEERLQEQTEEKIRSMVSYLPKLKVLSDIMLWRKEKHNVITSASGTKNILVFEGWTLLHMIKRLEKAIEKKTAYVEIEEIEAEEGEEPPVALENAKNIRPFETITRLYGLPAYRELDPTAYLAGFFFLFFGLCLTDVFYGLFIFALTASVLYFYRVPESTRPLIQLLMYGGIASSIIGLFFGGYLGISPEVFPQWVQSIQQFDPIANPLPIFYLSLALGFVQIMFGIILKMMTKFKNDEKWNGVLDEGPWLFFFLSLVLFGAQKIGFFSDLGEMPTLLVYGAVALLVITQGRKEKSILKRLFMGVASLYGLVGYFSDVLSYSRLLALGLATSALAFAINLIAQIVGDMIPILGPILAVLILIGGHMFNLMINTLGAFIHSARLQFVEFFDKFIAGGGRAMVPFARQQRHVVMDQERS